jgi:RimJ/RimL family protein N-acetyltransferase
MTPTLETARLRLRGHRIEDLGPCAAMWGDPEVTRHIGGQPFSTEGCWAKLLRYVGHWTLLGFGYWAIEERATGRFVGEVGFADFKREVTPSLNRVPELGWVLTRSAWGKGMATEAALAALGWGDVHFRGAHTVCLIDPNNAPSIRVAEKCGFVATREQHVYKGEPVLLFRRDPGSLPSPATRSADGSGED